MRWTVGNELKVGSRTLTIKNVIGPSDDDALSLIVEDEKPYLLWVGNHAWADDVASCLQEVDSPCLPRLVDVVETATEAFLLLDGYTEDHRKFEDLTWRNLERLDAVESLICLAEALGQLHRVHGWIQGIRRPNLLFDAVNNRLLVAAMPRFHLARKPAIEAAWRDMRLLGELAFEVFAQEAYPGGHEMASMLQAKGGLAGLEVNFPGVPQLLAGCVSPYGDLAYVDTQDLLEGLEQVRHELTRPLQLNIGQVSTVGNYIFRKNNQDSCGYVQLQSICGSRKFTGGFFCVADGIGGIQDGERASGQAVNTACAAFARSWVHYPLDELQSRPTQLARKIVKVVGQQLAVDGELDPHNNRGGTTFSSVVIAGRYAGVAHVGDSRAYLIRGGRIRPLTHDHTLANILTRLNELTPEQAMKNDVAQRTISRFLSTSAEVEWDRIDGLSLELTADLGDEERIEIFPGDIFILTSDGAHGEVEDHEILAFSKEHEDDPQQISESIAQLALVRLGRDNVTVLTVVVV